MRYFSVLATGVAFALTLGAIGCGESADDDKDDDNGEQTELEPLALTSDKLGVGFHHGEAGILEGNDLVDATTSTFSTAFVDVQVYDEHTWKFGEWEYYPPPNEMRKDYRTQSVFRDDPTNGKFAARAADLIEEVRGVFGDDGFGRVGVILDFWRSRGDWYVRWDGQLDDEANYIGEGAYGFYRDEMAEDVVSQLRTVASEQKPEYLVVGDGMGRLLAREGKPGLATDEFANFRRFYARAVSEVKKVSSSTRLGVGFDWDHFVRYVAPKYGPVDKGEIPEEETLERAFRAVLLPFARSGGMLALKSYRSDDGEAGYYEFLATLDERFEDFEDVEIVWYSIGSPVESSTTYTPQKNYFEAFVEWNAGVDPAVVAWRTLLNIDGVDQSDQSIGGRCKQLVEEERFQMPKRHCFDGLADTLFQKKGVFEAIESELE